jgi:hypothetical protein
MPYYLNTRNQGWLHIKDTWQDLKNKILSSDLLVSDLDGTDAKSPAIYVASDAFRRERYLTNIDFLKWAVKSPLKLLAKGDVAESELWSEFVEKFLRNPVELDRVRDTFTPEFTASRLYPGLIEFYGMLNKKIKKIYSTRNIKEIAESYKIAVGFDEAIAEQNDNVKALEDICKRYPHKRRLIIKENYDDTNLIDYLEFLVRNNHIDSYVTIFVTNSKSNLSPNFDINIGKDYTRLVQYLK